MMRLFCEIHAGKARYPHRCRPGGVEIADPAPPETGQTTAIRAPDRTVWTKYRGRRPDGLQGAAAISAVPTANDMQG